MLGTIYLVNKQKTAVDAAKNTEVKTEAVVEVQEVKEEKKAPAKKTNKK
jgi:hypothetical protein